MSPGYMPPPKRTDWETPADLFNRLAEQYGPFDLDPSGHPLSYVSRQCGTFYTSGGLEKPWYGRVFVNPPYGRVLGEWVSKAATEAESAALLVVALLPARTDTRWWHRYIGDRCQWADVTFLKGRLRFVGAPAAAPFPSVIVKWPRGPLADVVSGESERSTRAALAPGMQARTLPVPHPGAPARL